MLLLFFFNIAKFLRTVSKATNALRLRLWKSTVSSKISSEATSRLHSSWAQVSRLQDPHSRYLERQHFLPRIKHPNIL